MKYIIPLLLLLSSCRTQKHITTSVREENTDSVRVEALQEHIRMLEREIQERSQVEVDSSGVVVVFEPCDSSSTPAVTVDGGKVEASGPVRTVTVSNRRELQAYETRIRALQVDIDRLRSDSTARSSEVREVIKERTVDRWYIPIWVWFVMGVLLLMLLRAYWPRVLDLFIKKRTI